MRVCVGESREWDERQEETERKDVVVQHDKCKLWREKHFVLLRVEGKYLGFLSSDSSSVENQRASV